MTSSILFLVRYSESYDFSIKKKLDGQIAALRKMGYDVDYLSLERNGFYLIDKDGPRLLLKLKIRNFTEYWHSWACQKLYTAALLAVTKKKYDFVYMRSAPLFYSAKRLFKRMKADGSRLVVEIPTNTKEKPSRVSFLHKLYGLYSLFISSQVYKYVDLFAVYGNAMSKYHNKPAINITNGVSVDSFKPAEKIRSDGKTHLFAVASMSLWHGYDRLIKGLYEYHERDNIVFDLVGDEGDGSLKQWKSLVRELGLENNVVFHGKQYGDNLDRLFAIADLGIGTLAFNRVGIKESSVLKNREYMARGLPFIYSSKDNDLVGCSFCKQIPDDETPIKIDEIISFLDNVRKVENYSVQMREFAKKNLSWESQFEKVFSFFNKVGQQ